MIHYFYKILYFSKKSSIQNKLFLSYFIIITLIVTFVSVTFYKFSERIIEDQVGRSRFEVLNQIGINMKVIVNEIISVSNLYYFNDELHEILKKPGHADPFDKFQDTYKMENIFSKLNYSFNNPVLKYNTVVYGYNGSIYTSGYYEGESIDTIKKKPWYDEAVNKDGEILWVRGTPEAGENSQFEYGVKVVRIIKYKGSGESLGVLVMNIDENVLFSIYKNALGSGNNIYIVADDGGIISSNNKKILGLSYCDNSENMKNLLESDLNGTLIVKDNEKYLQSFYRLQEIEWKIVDEIPVNVILEPMNSIKYLVSFLLILSMILGFIASYLVAIRLSKPIKSLNHNMKEVKSGNLDVKSNLKRNDEIGELSIGFNSMLTRIKELMEDVRKEEQLKRRAEFDFLQAQINPHFLYNTLYSIRCMVSMEKNDSAEKMLIAFMRLLHKIFKNDEEYVTVDEEISSLVDYILIQKYKYEGKFEVIYNIDNDIRSYKMLKLLLQPLVENAIFHGIEPKKNKGMIVVTGYKGNDCIIFEIIDDGVGMTKEQAEDLLSGSGKEKRKEFNRVGVMNINSRIKINYGEIFGLRIESELNKGTKFILSLPVIE